MSSFHLDAKKLLQSGIHEDCPSGDRTFEVLDVPSQSVHFEIQSKEVGIFVGGFLWDLVRELEPSTLESIRFLADGSKVQQGTRVVEGRGDWSALLRWERTVLNMQAYLSGIATGTAQYVKSAHAVNDHVQITDTRKTLPQWRALAKHAVVCGGGVNHRMGLSDAILLKENHVQVMGGVRQTLVRLMEQKPKVPVEIELANMNDVDQLLETLRTYGKPENLQWVLLDNFSPTLLTEAVTKIKASSNGKSLKIEASGGIRLDTVKEFASTNVDRLSIGALTHSVRAFDLSMLVSHEME